VPEARPIFSFKSAEKICPSFEGHIKVVIQGISLIYTARRLNALIENVSKHAKTPRVRVADIGPINR